MDSPQGRGCRHDPSLYPSSTGKYYLRICSQMHMEHRRGAGQPHLTAHWCYCPRTVDSNLPLSKSTGSLPSARAVRGCQRARHGRHQRTFRKLSFQQIPHDRMLIRKDWHPIFDSKVSLLDPVCLRFSCLTNRLVTPSPILQRCCLAASPCETRNCSKGPCRLFSNASEARRICS